MNTRQTIEAYLEGVAKGSGWQAVLADDLEFTSYQSPVASITEKAAFLEGTKRFYSMIRKIEVRDLIVEGDRGCALTRYELQGPDGCAFSSDVAETFTVRGGKIVAFGIYFDTAPYPARKPAATPAPA